MRAPGEGVPAVVTDGNRAGVEGSVSSPSWTSVSGCLDLRIHLRGGKSDGTAKRPDSGAGVPSLPPGHLGPRPAWRRRSPPASDSRAQSLDGGGAFVPAGVIARTGWAPIVS